MKIVTYNVNGIRAAIKKGFIDWIKLNDFDIICLQEVKANEHEVELEELKKLGYNIEWFAATKKGYSGVAIFSKLKYNNIIKGNGYKQSDFEGRVIQAEYKDFLLINTYFPSGSSGEERQNYKYEFLNDYLIFLNKQLKQHKNIIVVGDYNICHKNIDIHDPISNKNSSGFLPEEREWFDKFYNLGFIDSFRNINPHPHQYTWWSFRANAKNNNKGWRIDYINISAGLQKKIIDAKLFPEILCSDHCPVLLEIDI